MKTSHKIITVLLALSGLTAANAAELTPAAEGDAAVASAISGRVNYALSSGGATAFSSSDLNAGFTAPLVNNGIINGTANSWIAVTAGPTEFVAVAPSAPLILDAIVFQGQTGYNGRSSSIWSLEYTTDAGPSAGSVWTQIGTYTYVEPTCAQPMPRTLFSFPAVTGVTAVRLVATTTEGCVLEKAVQELELYGSLGMPPAILAHPSGGTFTEGDEVSLTVAVAGAETLQWRLDGVDIPGANGTTLSLSDIQLSDAGTYTFMAANGLGSVTSDDAVIVVEAAPVFASYGDAIFTDNPIHYYPLDEVSGTNANDLGSLAVLGGTYLGGFTLGQPSAQPGLGTSVRFDGLDGSLVDLGLFHPGDNVTVEAWAKLEPDARPNSFHAVVARWDGSFELDFANTELANFVVRNDSNGFGSGVAAQVSGRGQWHHLVGIFSGGVVTIYVDGVKGGEQNIGGVLQDAGPTPDRIMIGATRAGGFAFRGSIDEVAIYDYALTPVQIRNHFRTAVNQDGISLELERAVIVSWPTFPAGIIPQSSTSVEGPYENVTGTVYFEDDKAKVALPIDGTVGKFFRLLIP